MHANRVYVYMSVFTVVWPFWFDFKKCFLWRLQTEMRRFGFEWKADFGAVLFDMPNPNTHSNTMNDEHFNHVR